MMTHNHQKFFLLHLMLYTVLAVGILMMYFLRGYADSQYLTIIFLAGFYFVWGVTYHGLKGDLHPKIVIEYFLIMILAVLLARGAIFPG